MWNYNFFILYESNNYLLMVSDQKMSYKNKKPYVILNSAMTLDGKMATKTGNSKISGKEDLVRVHELRKEVDAIMVGINTVLVDDPKLTVHKIPGSKHDNPLRVIVDSNARTPESSRVLNSDAPTIIAVTASAPPEKVETLKKRVEVIECGQKRVES